MNILFGHEIRKQSLEDKEIPTAEFLKLDNRLRFEIGYEPMLNKLFTCKYPMNSV